MSRASEVTLAEELLLLSFSPDSGKALGRRRSAEYGMAAAALAGLEAEGRVAHHRGRISVTDGGSTGEPVLDSALGLLPSPGKSIRVRRWIRRARKGVTTATAQRLADRGAIRIEKRHVLGIFPYNAYPSVGAEWSADALARFQLDARSGFTEPRARILAALIAASGLARRIDPGSGDARTTRRLMRGLIREQWQADAVRAVIRSDDSAA